MLGHHTLQCARAFRREGAAIECHTRAVKTIKIVRTECGLKHNLNAESSLSRRGRDARSVRSGMLKVKVKCHGQR